MALVGLLVLSGACRLPGSHGALSSARQECRELSQLAASALDHGDWQEAERHVLRAIRLCPTDAEARRYYAEVLWHRGQTQAALQQLETASRLADKDAATHVALAKKYLALGQIAQAERAVSQAMRLDSKLPAGWVMQGELRQAQGRLREAMADYYRALALRPEDRDIHARIADLYLQLGEPHRALTVLRTLAETYGPGEEPQPLLLAQGRAYTALGRHAEALEAFSAAARRTNPTPEILCALGEAQLRAGRAAEAAATAQEALAMDPQHAASRQLLARANSTLR